MASAGITARVRHRWLFVCPKSTEGLLARELLADFVPFVTGRPWSQNLDEPALTRASPRAGSYHHRLEASDRIGRERADIEELLRTDDADAHVAYMQRRLVGPRFTLPTAIAVGIVALC